MPGDVIPETTFQSDEKLAESAPALDLDALNNTMVLLNIISARKSRKITGMRPGSDSEEIIFPVWQRAIVYVVVASAMLFKFVVTHLLGFEQRSLRAGNGNLWAQITYLSSSGGAGDQDIFFGVLLASVAMMWPLTIEILFRDLFSVTFRARSGGLEGFVVKGVVVCSSMAILGWAFLGLLASNSAITVFYKGIAFLVISQVDDVMLRPMSRISLSKLRRWGLDDNIEIKRLADKSFVLSWKTGFVLSIVTTAAAVLTVVGAIYATATTPTSGCLPPLESFQRYPVQVTAADDVWVSGTTDSVFKKGTEITCELVGGIRQVTVV